MSVAAPPFDRRETVLASTSLNGIDYVEVRAAPPGLVVHFLNTVPMMGTLSGPPTITGGGAAAGPSVLPVDEVSAWTADSQGRPLLSLRLVGAADASTHILTVNSSALDPFFAQSEFSFQPPPAAADCATAINVAPEPPEPPVTIDYLAKDFASFAQALSEFSALRYPGWVERSEADFGVMLMEAMAAVADELSYYQDRVAAEATLATATQRLSLVRHARLVDYEPTPATVATTVLQLDVSPLPDADSGSTSWTIATALRFQALAADGSTIPFEVEDPGLGLSGTLAASPAPWATVDQRWNRSLLSPRGPLSPYWWDESQRCLQAGAMTLDVVGQQIGLYTGQQLLLDTPSPTGADPPTRELVTVSTSEEISDPLSVIRAGFPSPPVKLTRISFAAPTAFEHDLLTTAVAGNIVPAVQGALRTETFTIPGAGTASQASVVIRRGPRSTPEAPLPDYRYCLPRGPLAWLASKSVEEYSATPAEPEIVLGGASPSGGDPVPWRFARWLLDCGPADRVFTLTPEQYSPVLTSNGSTWLDYDGDAGTTIRFGDGTSGAVPTPGTSFTVSYRVGLGPLGNVPADSVVTFAPGQLQPASVNACTNPFAATGGADAETNAQIRSRAPQRFGAELLRAVRPEDYVAAAQSLPWVKQAGTEFRWTGSWTAALTTVDAVGAESPEIAQLEAVTTLLGARRMAGYDSYVRYPRYVAIDLDVVVAGLASAFASDVQQAVIAGLAPGTLPTGQTGFFDHTRWAFGQVLEASALLAAIQACPGVVGVESIHYRLPGLGVGWRPLNESVPVAPDQIIQLDNDPNRPAAGQLTVTAQGSK